MMLINIQIVDNMKMLCWNSIEAPRYPTPMPSPFDYQTLLTRLVGDHVLLVTLNRPDTLNAMNAQMAAEGYDLLERLRTDPGAVRVVVVHGAGRAFSSGADLKDRAGHTRDDWIRLHGLAERTTELRVDCPVPWIAAVRGACYAGGLEMALTCDFIYAERDARFALTECQLGLIPGTMGTQTLSRAVGERRAKELILGARVFTAEEAHQWGMVNEVCEPGTVVDQALAAAARIAACAPLAVRQAKKAIHHGLQTDLHTGYRFELEAWYRLLDTQDRHEGVAAFVEKRPPRFQGC